jgi:DUF2075 family protein/predicted GIY-YIG superfamily endonuclease
MSSGNTFEVSKFQFTPSVTDALKNIYFANELWPVVYLLSDEKMKEAYVGESTDVLSRMDTHLGDPKRNKLSALHLITSKRFHKSATLDIESNLIKYISGDGKYKLINANVGVANHNYYEKKEIYWDIFKSLWDNLRSVGIVGHSVEYISNSDLFKYSPYKSLNKDQRNSLLEIMRSLLRDNIKANIVEGGAGTGKTILAVFLFKLLKSDIEDFDFKEFEEDEEAFVKTVLELKMKYPDPNIKLVVPMASFRGTLKKVFKNVKGLHENMVIGPAEISKGKFDIVLVDESHRLRRRVGLGPYFKVFDIVCKQLNMDKQQVTELDWLLQQSHKLILFYDEEQSIRPSDVRKYAFDQLIKSGSTCHQELKSQLRVKGGVDYIDYVRKLLTCSFQPGEGKFKSRKYSFLLFNDIDDFVEAIKRKDQEDGLSRFAAGYSWKWVSKKNKILFDINIGNKWFRWNSTKSDWINSRNASDEVGCIHTTQGYDLNYAGIIFGDEISYDKVKNEIIIRKQNYHDKSGKLSIKDPEELKGYIYRIYSTLLKRGISGTYIYVCDPDLREYFARHIETSKTKLHKAEPAGTDVLLDNAV